MESCVQYIGTCCSKGKQKIPNVISAVCENAASIYCSTQQHWMNTNKEQTNQQNVPTKASLCTAHFWPFCWFSMSKWTVALLQDRDIHRLSGHSCALQPIHSTRNYIFQLSVARWWKYIGGMRMCEETQSAQSRARKHAIKVSFIETRLLTYMLCFWYCSYFFKELDSGCLFIICVRFHIFLEAQCCCINYSFNWVIYKYIKLKIS